MQQHTGQHILSAAFDRLFQNRTLSFHMGAEVSTIDLAKAQSPEDVERAVDDANRVVWENRPVTVRFASADEARTMGLRKESVREGELRLVDVTDFDLSACGGTHVPRTGTIGVIAVTGTEKFKGGLRVSFVCGGRALTLVPRTARLGHRLGPRAVGAAGRTARRDPEAAGRVEGAPQARRRPAGCARRPRSGAAACGGASSRRRRDRHRGHRRLGRRGPEGDCISDHRPAPPRPSPSPAATCRRSSSPVVVRREPCDRHPGAGDLVKALTAKFGGKGGGTPELAQAGGLVAAPRDVIAAAHELLTTTIQPSSALSSVGRGAAEGRHAGGDGKRRDSDRRVTQEVV